MAKVSVIIPVYNMENYLAQCLDSVLGQTLKELEAVCIDDGSTDSSEQILEDYRQRDERVVLIRQQNQGVSAARNHGIEAASGKYVIFMDPDDWYPSEDVLETLYEGAEKFQVCAAGGSFMDFHDGIYNDQFPERYYGYHFDKEGMIEYSDYQFDFGYQRFLFDRQMLLDHGIKFKPYIRYQDPPFFVEAMICAGRFYGVDKPAYCYRYGHTRISWNKEKVCDLLQGLRDNLDISRKFGLARLHNLTVTRLNEEYRQLLGDSIFYEDYAPDVMEALMETLEHIDRDLLDQSHAPLEGSYNSIAERIREDVRMHVDRIGQLEGRVHQLEQQVCELEEIRDQQQERIFLKEKQAEQTELARRRALEEAAEERRLKEEVYRSFSYRVGHAVTIVPRALGRAVRVLARRR